MASIADNYEINVAKKRNPDDKYGVHFCKIELPEWDNEAQAECILMLLRELFGDEYRLSMTHWTCRGNRKEGWE